MFVRLSMKVLMKDGRLSYEILKNFSLYVLRCKPGSGNYLQFMGLASLNLLGGEAKVVQGNEAFWYLFLAFNL